MASYYRGYIYALGMSFYHYDMMMKIDAATGGVVDQIANASSAPAFFGDIGYFKLGEIINSQVSDSLRLEARSLTTGRTLWTFRGRGKLMPAPIIVNGKVLICASPDVSDPADLYVLDGQTGAILQKIPLGRVVQNILDEDGWGFAAGENTILVSVERKLIAFKGS
jgi:hypothetical protein